MDFKKIFKSKYFIGALIIIGLILLDQITKQLAFINQSYLVLNRPVVIPGLLELGYHENPDASLGFLGDVAYKELIFVLVTLVALAIFGYLYKDIDLKNRKVYSISIIFFFAGTLGNAFDRLFRGYVIDFAFFPFFNFLNHIGLSNFYNNIADDLLSFAIVLFAIDLFFLESKYKEKMKEQATNESINQG